ncbi:MAG: SDR family oxidoreductase [Deltaproteobacteria bacterium]|jgi:NAD(P)-dependent dehydrogenase (short-subunit alcohol dehydrogenase family)|nr:SDR family oxidoreductase [Deltaproteobacteria bacterium]
MTSVKELMSLEGRTALITGGAGHIGFCLAQSLAELGCRIALADISAEKCLAKAAEIKINFGVETFGHGLDVANEEDLKNCPDLVAQRLGGLNIIINAAAFGGDTVLPGWVTPFEEQSQQTWRAALEVNLTAPVFLVQAAASILRDCGHASVINVSSIYGFLGPDMRLYEGTNMGNPAAYATSKGGLIQVTRWLSTVLAPDVRVNSLSPGGVWRSQPEAFVTRYVQRTPMGRMAREDDFIGAAIFLASDMSAYVTGQHLAIDGGFGVW